MASLKNYYSEDDKPASGFEPMPAGDYIAAIVDSGMQATKANDGEYLKLTWDVLEGPYKGRKLFENLNLTNKNPQAVEIARGQFAAIRKATNVISPNDSSELHNIPILIKVGCKKDDLGEIRNVIKAYKPKNAATTTAAASTGAPGSAPPWMKKS